jgi:hypothetical protein
MTIGRLRFPYQQRTAEAVLEDDGRWQCPEVPSLVRVLDILYSPRRDGSAAAADEHRARRHLHAAAQWLKGTVDSEVELADRN